MEFRVLGEVGATSGGRLLPLRAGRQRTLLAVLLLRANRVVSTSQLIDELWDADAPATAVNLIQQYVSRLRTVLRAGPDGGGAPRLVTRHPGYLLRVEPGELDLDRFEGLVQEGGRALAAGETARGADTLGRALALWRGPALADIEPAPSRRDQIARLEGRRTAALEERIDADLRLGRHAALVAELEALVAQHPTRERMHARLMLSLYRSGRQVDALAAYRDLRRRLVDELGVEPTADLQRLHQAMLACDPGLEVSSLGAGNGARMAPPPGQLPPDVVDLTGRERECAELRRLLAHGQGRTAVPVAMLTGKAGVGKTVVAVRVAHQLRAGFPDGQLYVDLRGAGPQPLDPAEVLADFMRALGVDGGAIPDGLGARTRSYRALLADRELLVVLDNAASEAQVRHLLPGGSRCAAIITSRSRLAGLAAPSIVLDVLSRAAAVELLAKVAGPERIGTEAAAANELAGLCGDLPLAVRIAGARLAARAHWRVAKLVGLLADERRRLGELAVGDLEVRASVALSYEARPAEEQRAFRLLGLLPGTDFASWTAAALLEVSPGQAEDLLERLVEARLLEAVGEDGCGQLRYRFHDLLRVFARECLLAADPPETRDGALEGYLDACVALAERATARLQPGNRPASPTDPSVGADMGEVGEVVDGEPLGWLRAERAVLVGAVEQACAAGRWRQAVDLAVALRPYFEQCTLWKDWRHTHELALGAARQAGDRVGEAAMLRGLGHVYGHRTRRDEAFACLDASLAISRAIGDVRGEAATLRIRGQSHWIQGHLREALACYDRYLAIVHELGDEHGEARGLLDLGDAYRHQGRLDDANDAYDRCRRTFARLGDELWEAYALRGLGSVQRHRGRWDEAADAFDAALAVFRRLRDRRGEALTLRGLGLVQRERGRAEQAAAHLQQCWAIQGELGDRLGQACTLQALGGLLREQGRLGEAAATFEACLATFEEQGVEGGRALALQGLGDVLRAQGREEQALRYVSEALSTFRARGHRRYEGRALTSLGQILAAGGAQAEARAAWQEAATILHEVGAPEARGPVQRRYSPPPHALAGPATGGSERMGKSAS